ncbi:hypothetical protein [Schlesneria paludicola]|uniref:hypothetical protein n=1 Tax=Schlesneria paludicola TaxID=360056 RepID=UPI00029A30B4|nr:hypothetical protein [Schlesneria paludicola]
MPYRFAYLVGFIVVTMPGCLYHGGYPNGYNYGGNPAVLQPQPYNGYPSGGYPPGSYPSGPTYTPGAPYNQPSAPLYPPTTSPTPLNGGGGTFTPTDPLTTPNSPPDQNPSTYGPDFKTSPNNGVPEPDDTNNGRSSQGTTLTPTSGARSTEMDSPFQQEESRIHRNFEHQNVADDDSPFESPLKRTASEEEEGAGEAEIQYANRETLSMPETSKTYGHDPKFKWIKGVVEFDEPSGTWLMMYDDKPGASDDFGGFLALGDHPKLKNLKSGDIVRIDGAFDPDRKDSRGLNLYQPNKIKKQ